MNEEYQNQMQFLLNKDANMHLSSSTTNARSDNSNSGLLFKDENHNSNIYRQTTFRASIN